MRKRSRSGLGVSRGFLPLVVVSLVPLMATTTGAEGISAPSNTSTQRPGAPQQDWREASIASPVIRAGDELSSVSAVSAADAWAVGTSTRETTESTETLILHWDGTRWSRVASPNPSSTTNWLNGVDALSADDAWAVGVFTDDKTGASRSLILHWDGGDWAQVPSPNPSEEGNYITDVSASTGTDAWAVGGYTTDSGLSPNMVVHWDGSAWAMADAPDLNPDESQLLGVSARSTSNAWAVGYYEDPETHGYLTLTLRWNGTRWSHVPSPNPGSVNTLSDVRAGRSETWAVGYVYRSPRINTVILRWNGRRWAETDHPRVGRHLVGIGGSGPHDVWAVGASGGNVLFRGLIYHWDGERWSKDGFRDPDVFEVGEVSASSRGDAWAIGNYGRILLHWDGTSWSRV